MDGLVPGVLVDEHQDVAEMTTDAALEGVDDVPVGETPPALARDAPCRLEGGPGSRSSFYKPLTPTGNATLGGEDWINW